MTNSEFAPPDPGVINTITRCLKSLKQTTDGDELYALIARAERRFQRLGAIDAVGLAELRTQLGRYAQDPINLPNMRIRARLLQQHLAIYLTAPPVLPTTPSIARPDTQITSRAVERPEIAAPPTAQPAPAPAPAQAQATVMKAPVNSEPSSEDLEKYQTLLRSEKDAWQAIYGTVKDYQHLKQAWMDSLNDLARHRTTLEQQLEQAREHATQVEADRARLMAELARARTEPATSLPAPLANNDILGLPPRTAFARHVAIEVQRVKRTPRPLALGLIAVDDLHEIDELYGVGARAAVLACYANDILANFRAHDVVAHYDDEQFALLFPDTRKKGATRALEKIKKHATESHVSHSGTSFALPGFRGVVVLYSPGEGPNALLARLEQELAETRRGAPGGSAKTAAHAPAAGALA